VNDRASNHLSIPGFIVCLAAAVSLYEWLVFFTTFNHPGLIGLDYIAVGTDWMVFHGAARSLWTGQFCITFDGNKFTDYLNGMYHDVLWHPLPFRPWVNPPSFAVVVAPFGLLSFWVSFAAFELISAAMLFIALSRGDYAIPKPWSVLILLSPAAAVCCVVGQLSFFCAALFIGGMNLSARRPFVAALLLGLLTVKPQFFLFVPIALIAEQRWKVLLATMASALLLAVISALILGVEAWRVWISQTLMGLSGENAQWVEYGRLWGTSVFASTAALGFSLATATRIQAAALVISIIGVFLVYRSAMPHRIKLAFLLGFTIFGTPHSAAPDCILLVVAMMFWLAEYPIWQDSLLPWTAPFCLWMLPMFTPAHLTKVGGLLPVVIVIFLAQIFHSYRRVTQPRVARPA
jgi:hypothetical protein